MMWTVASMLVSLLALGLVLRLGCVHLVRTERYLTIRRLRQQRDRMQRNRERAERMRRLKQYSVLINN